MSHRNLVHAQIDEERERQDIEWGGPDHDDRHSYVDWATFIRKQLDAADVDHLRDDPIATRERFLKIAALAFAAIESIDRIDDF